MDKILWDTDNDEPATNWDGSVPDVIEGEVIIKELGCNCDPASGSTCGGCSETHMITLAHQFQPPQHGLT